METKRRWRKLELFRPRKGNLTLKGRRGKPLRIVLYIVAAILVAAVSISLLRPRVRLENTAEIRQIREIGVLNVGVMDDIPGFSEGGQGLEIELAELFSAYLLPDTEPGAAVKFTIVTDKTASTRLSDGTVDAVFALMRRGSSSRFSYSYAYYTDECVIAIPEGSEEKPIDEMTIGYVRGSASGAVLNEYISAHETKAEQSLVDKLLKRTVELPADAVTFTTKVFASYPDMLSALENGRIDGAAIARVYLNKYADEFSFSVHSVSVGDIEYALACSSDSSAIAQLADMFIYELKQDGGLDALLIKYGLK